jgi:hypothetical protein
MRLAKRTIDDRGAKYVGIGGIFAAFQEMSWFMLAPRDQFVSHFLHCRLAVSDDIVVHHPFVLADFMGTSKNMVCKYMKEWNWKSKNESFINSAKVDRHSGNTSIVYP